MLLSEYKLKLCAVSRLVLFLEEALHLIVGLILGPFFPRLRIFGAPFQARPPGVDEFLLKETRNSHKVLPVIPKYYTKTYPGALIALLHERSLHHPIWDLKACHRRQDVARV